jgi:hypothetical protein
MSINPFLQQVSSDTTVHDYAHADRIFRTDAFRLHPKFAFLYYVRINLSPDYTLLKGTHKTEIGSLVKSVTLPKFNVENKTLNAYNRVNIVQTKLKYEPVTIKFHDDGADIIREFWYDYYSFYFRDSDHATSLYQGGHKYNLRQTDQWGFTPRETGGKEATAAVTQLITDIQIFSFHNKKFSEVTLHNPVITSFRHGDHDYAQGTGILENEMVVNFETVTYASGFFTEENFGSDMLLKYDTTPSNISPANVNGVPGQELSYQNGQVFKPSSQTVPFRGGNTNAPNSLSMQPKAGAQFLRSGSNILGPLGRPGQQTGTNMFGTPAGQRGKSSVFGTAAQGILSGMISSAIRGRNPLSQFSVPNASNLLYQAGSAVGGVTGQKIIASAGLLRAGQTIARNGVGPGNFGTVAVAIGALGQLGVRPENILPNVFGGRATTNGSGVARTSGPTATVSSPNFPTVNTPANNTTSSYYSTPNYSDGRSVTVNDSRATFPSSNQGRPGSYGRFF